MDKIVWDESFSVGLKDMDEQHKQIINIVNKLTEIKEMHVNSEIISATLSKMREYADNHFKKEETYLLESDYPFYSMHKIQHRGFRKKTVDFCMDTIAYKSSIPTGIVTYLRKQLVSCQSSNVE